MRFVKIVGPGNGDTFEIRVKNTLNSILKENKGKHIVKLEIIVNIAHTEGFSDEQDYIQGTIKAVFKNKIPAFSIIHIPICNGSEFTVQYQMYDSEAKVAYKTLLGHPYVTAESKAGIELFSGAISFKEDSLLFAAQRCFDLAEQILMAEDMNFGHIYRQWNYIPNFKKTTEDTYITNDKLSAFNEIKDFYYEGPLFINGKPINSNIHSFNNTLLIDFIAFATDVDNSDTAAKEDIGWLNNYPDLNTKWVFDGKPELWFSSRPLLPVPSADYKNKQLQKQDVEKQTIQNLKSIVELMEASRAFMNTIGKLSFMKVNVKQGQDYKIVEELIKCTLPQIQTLFVNSVPNNPDLLVEMEGLIN